MHHYCILYGNHLEVAQRMLDYDFLCGRDPSVVAIMVDSQQIRPQRLFFGDREVLIPQINVRSAVWWYPHARHLINFASYRSAPAVIEQAMKTRMFDTIYTVAEWIPERETRRLIALNERDYQITLIGPSVVGALYAGSMRVGNTWGSMTNIIASRLYQAGSVAIASKSGGMMNELCRVVSRTTDGVHSAVQLWGDRFPMTSFAAILRDFEHNSDIKMIVLLGELGNRDELEVAEMIAQWQITKPVVAWVAGTSAASLTAQVQFGHAGAQANTDQETAIYKNQALAEAWAFVPSNFSWFESLIAQVFADKVSSCEEYVTPMQMDKLLIQSRLFTIKNRRPSILQTRVSDERWSELLYRGLSLSDYLDRQSLGYLIGMLWRWRALPDYACRFLESCVILLADHGPAVSGAVNTIITARAGKQLPESLATGLLTIGPRFGGAITDAARRWLDAVHTGTTPEVFVSTMKQQGVLIPGIGHKIKSIHNPDSRCQYLRTLAEQYPHSAHLDFALAVEKLTTAKKPNLILNVDGMIGALLCDMMVDIGLSHDEILRYVDADICNALFIWARSLGFIAHHIDQKIHQAPLFRMPWDEINYE